MKKLVLITMLFMSQVSFAQVMPSVNMYKCELSSVEIEAKRLGASKPVSRRTVLVNSFSEDMIVNAKIKYLENLLEGNTNLFYPETGGVYIRVPTEIGGSINVELTVKPSDINCRMIVNVLNPLID